MPTQSRTTEPELDEALTRAIRQLISEAIEAGAPAGSAGEGVVAA